MKDIAEWLASLDLGEYAQRFAENAIDLSVIRDLTENDLEELGVLLGHRRKMLRAIAELQGEAASKPQTSAEPGRDRAERRQLTVMFCDLVGSTALSARLDPEDMRQVIALFHRRIAEVIDGYQGIVARYMGDGVLAYFGYPQAHEDDAEQAVRAGLALVEAVANLQTGAEAPLQIRVGIAKLSREQLTVARQRAKQAQLDERVRFTLNDYREIEGRFDRIVSVGMFEHVGVPNYARFFQKIRELLSADGIALIHSIGRSNGPGITSAWTRKYIFPGGHIPALSEVAPVIERAGLVLTDLEILRLHYAETLRHWRERFVASHRREGRIYDERFCRMWEFYLAASEMAFRYGGLMVFQAQLARRLDGVPLTRDYMYEREREESWIGSTRQLTSVKREAQV